MSIANISNTNTFTEWYTRDNQMAVELNRMLSGIYVTSGNITITNATTGSPYSLNVVGNTKSTTIELASGSNTAPALRGPASNATGFFFPNTNTFAIVANSHEAIYVLPSGNTGIGTTNPQQKLDVVGRMNVTGYAAITGNTGINKLSPAYALDVVGDIWATGNITMESDVRVKEDILPIQDALNIVRSLDGVSFTHKDTQTRRIGLVAQEVLKTFPMVVSQRPLEDGGHMGINYATLVALLIEAIKELEKKVADLERDI